MTSIPRRPMKGASLPDPVPALSRFYRVPEAGIDTRRYIGLDRNERLTPFPDWFVENIRRAVTSTLLTWYPVQDHLYRQLSAVLEVPEERLILTPSSDAAFKAVYQAYVRPGDRIVMLDPSYGMFPVYADMFEGEAVLVPYNRNVELDTEFLLESITPGVRLLMLANPNQPTGTLLEEDLLLEVIEKAASVGALVAMDEAYYPFAGTTALPWLEAYPNLLVIRTFSKAAGLAGLRIGFVAAHQEVIVNLFKVRTVNDLNSMSVLCASEVLKHPEVIDEYVADVEAGKRVLLEHLELLGVTVLPTHANFVLIRVGPRCQPILLVEALKQHGYLVKCLQDFPCVDDCIRVTIGPPELMASFAQSLGEVLDTVSGAVDSKRPR